MYKFLKSNFVIFSFTFFLLLLKDGKIEDRNIIIQQKHQQKKDLSKKRNRKHEWNTKYNRTIGAKFIMVNNLASPSKTIRLFAKRSKRSPKDGSHGSGNGSAQLAIKAVNAPKSSWLLLLLTAGNTFCC